jgi:hypothetical protein
VIGAGRAGAPLFQLFGRTAATTFATPFGTNMYDSLQAMLERRFNAGFQIAVGYTWSKVIGWNDNSDSGPAVNSLAYFERNRVVRGYDRPHNLQISNVIELPFGKGKLGRAMEAFEALCWAVGRSIIFSVSTAARHSRSAHRGLR